MRLTRFGLPPQGLGQTPSSSDIMSDTCRVLTAHQSERTHQSRIVYSVPSLRRVCAVRLVPDCVYVGGRTKLINHVLTQPTFCEHADMTYRSRSSRAPPRKTAAARNRAEKREQGANNPFNGASAKRGRGRGRPLLSSAQLAARTAARASKKIKWRETKEGDAGSGASAATLLGKARSRRQNGSSLLEKLPVELLERVFLYALDPNFCRASPYLASAVSSERIYRTLIRLAFFQDDDGSEESQSELPTRRKRTGRVMNAIARERIAEAFKPADYETMWLGDAERAHLQAMIMKCRWCTKRRIEDQLPALMRMAIQKHWVGADMTLSDPVQQASLNRLLQLPSSEIIEDAPPASTEYFRGIGPGGHIYYMTMIPLVSVSIGRETNAGFTHVHRVLNLRAIPEYLLRGSRSEDGKGSAFTEEDIDLLEILRHEYGWDGTGHDVHFSRDALHAGIRNALTARNARALTTLLRVDEFFFRRRLEFRPPPSFENPEYHYAIPGEHFVQAVRLPMPDAMTFFKLLLRCNAESIPPDSSEITQWAMELSSGFYAEDDMSITSDADPTSAFGRWLLDFMIDLPRAVEDTRRNPERYSLFYYGALNFHSMGRRYHTEVCGGRDDDYHSIWAMPWIHELSYDVSKTWSD